MLFRSDFRDRISSLGDCVLVVSGEGPGGAHRSSTPSSFLNEVDQAFVQVPQLRLDLRPDAFRAQGLLARGLERSLHLLPDPHALLVALSGMGNEATDLKL